MYFQSTVTTFAELAHKCRYHRELHTNESETKPSPESRQQDGFTFVRGGFMFVQGRGLDMTKIPLIHCVSYFNLGGLELCLGG